MRLKKEDLQKRTKFEVFRKKIGVLILKKYDFFQNR